MSEQLLKPYEISVWEDVLTQNGEEKRFEEKKLAVIGSNTMTGLNKVYDPVFNKKANGERTLSFSLKYKYFDPYSENEEVVNPFIGLLTNERKVKLHYDNQWYEFIVKDHTESSNEYTWDYTCTDAFVLELSKNGYNITFNADLNNNQGTARELATETLKNTDWRVGESGPGRQYVAEPVYKGEIIGSLEVLNTDTKQQVSVDGEVYVFYTYVKNNIGKFVQFISSEDVWTVDDNNVVTSINYRILQDVTITYDEESGWKIKDGDTTIITFNELETNFQANRLVYNQLTTYDPVMKRTVDRFKAGDREIYKYTDYTYTTSNVLTNFVTNGENFNVLENGTLQGWNPYVKVPQGETVKKLELKTKPELSTGKELANLSVLSQIEGFLKVEFNGALTNDYENAIYNSGIEDNAAFIESISKGQKFVFRWRAGQGNFDELTPATSLRLLVAKYTQDTPVRYGHYYRYIDPDNIILQFEGTPKMLNNIIEGGALVLNENDEYDYVIDDVVQTPSTKYIYIDNNDNKKYVWGGENGTFEELDEVRYSNYVPYYYLVAEAQQPIPNSSLKDVTEKYGIFIYNRVGDITHYLQDIQLTRFIPDASDPTGETPILMGNIPTAVSAATEYYYIKPADGAAAEDIKMYTSAEELRAAYEIADEIVPLYNENSEKYLSISASQSNCFDILQTIAETFECWVDLVVGHDPDTGYITYDDNGKPNKFVYLREYAGKDNYAGFKYGINLDSIERNVNSDEIVTKLIVDQSQSDYVDAGYVSIASSPSNISKESYILNFNYYYNQGILNREEVEADRLEFVSRLSDLNTQIQENELRRNNLEASMLALGSKRNVYTELIKTAKDTKNEALGEFENLTGKTYDEYREEHTSLEETEQLTEEETILEVLGKLYVNSSVINSYSGLLTNIEEEYWQVRKELRGSENYKVKIWTGRDDNDQRHVFVELNDYLPGFEFEIGDSTYESSVSRKYFDIEKDDTVITFTAPEGYTIDPTEYTINDAEIVTFKIISDETDEGVEDVIEDLREEKDQLTKDFNNRYSRFIQEGTWSSTDYIDSDIYYLDALQISNTSAQPAVSYTINVVEISQLEGFEWYLFDAGEKTYIEDTEFFGWADVNGILTPAREEVIVSEVEWHLDEPDKNVITVQNYKTRFEDLFQRISATVQTVQYNEATYAKISTLLDATGTINQNVLLNSLNDISGKNYNLTSDGSVLIDGDAILVRNLNNAANCVIINSEGIRVSSDGGNNWTTAIDGQGINIGTVYTGTLNTNEVIIGNSDNPSFRWDKSGISAFKSNQDGTYDLQTYVRYDQYGLYGIKNDVFKAQNLEDVLEKAHFAVTWDGFFIKNSYEGGGRVEITSDNDFRVLNTVNQQENEKIKIGALEWKAAGWQEGDPIYTNPETVPDAVKQLGPSLYGIRIKNDSGAEVMKTDDDGNIVITGTLNALGGNFTGIVNVGPENQDHIIIDGTDASIRTSNYQDGAGSSTGYGWLINKDGDAVFNNITARGAIKTAVFEYAEIQAVGGVFIFRPSSTIKTARVEGNDLIVTVEKPMLFEVGSWCKVSNYVTDGGEPQINDTLTTNGLTHVYKIGSKELVNGKYEITLLEGKDLVDVAINGIDGIPGGSLVNFGYTEETYKSIEPLEGTSPAEQHLYELINDEYVLTTDVTIDASKTYYRDLYQGGVNNYGIGINSSDNSVNLPARAISLFETEVNDTETLKVNYKYRAILGTLPVLQYTGANPQVNSYYHNYLEGTQGIYTDNMYIGDSNNYLVFYTDKTTNKKHLRIKASDMIFSVDDDTGEEITWDDHIEEIAGQAESEDSIDVIIASSNGDKFVNDVGSTVLKCQVILGGKTDITSEYNEFTWHSFDKNGIEIISENPQWPRITTTPQITITAQDVDERATFTCDVDIDREGNSRSLKVIVSSSNGDKFLNHNVITTLSCKVVLGGTHNVTNEYDRFVWQKIYPDGTTDAQWNASHITSVPTINITYADMMAADGTTYESKITFSCSIEI